MAALASWERFHGAEIPWYSYLIIVALTFVVACCLAWLQEQTKLAAVAASRAILDVDDPYCVTHHGVDDGSWEIQIINKGAPARHVHLQLRNINPRPNSEYWTSDYPYSVIQAGRTLGSNDCHINKGESATFEITKIWNGAHDTGFLCALDTKRIGQLQIKINHGEDWIMQYEITAENCDLVPFSLRMRANAGGIVFERIK